MIDDISPPGSWVRELSARPHTYRDVWAALREAEARLAAVEAERDALRAALDEFERTTYQTTLGAEDNQRGASVYNWRKAHLNEMRATAARHLAAREAT